MRFYLPIILLALALAVTGCPKDDPQDPADPVSPYPETKPPIPVEPPPAAELAPDFNLQTMDGRQVQLSNLRGKVVVLCFWSLRCPACRMQMPVMDELYRQMAGTEVEVLTVTWGAKQDALKVIKELNIRSAPVMLDPGMKVTEAYGIKSVPTTVLIDKQGRITAREVGAVNWLDQANLQRITSLR